MGLRTYTNWLLCLTVIAFGASAWGLSIPPEQQDLQKIFYGVADKFEKPARVNYQEIVKGIIIVAAVVADQYRQRNRRSA